MKKRENLSGQRFGRLTVIERAGEYRPRNDPKNLLQTSCGAAAATVATKVLFSAAI